MFLGHCDPYLCDWSFKEEKSAIKDAYDLGTTLFFLLEQKSFEFPPKFSGTKDVVHQVIKELVAIDDDYRTKVEDLNIDELR